MRKVTIKLELEVVVQMDEGIEVGEVLDGLNIYSDDSAVDFLDHTIIDHEVIDSK